MPVLPFPVWYFLQNTVRAMLICSSGRGSGQSVPAALATGCGQAHLPAAGPCYTRAGRSAAITPADWLAIQGEPPRAVMSRW